VFCFSGGGRAPCFVLWRLESWRAPNCLGGRSRLLDEVDYIRRIAQFYGGYYALYATASLDFETILIRIFNATDLRLCSPLYWDGCLAYFSRSDMRGFYDRQLFGGNLR